MDFATVALKHGEQVTQQAILQLVARMRQILQYRLETAVNGVLNITMEELREDAQKVAVVLDDFPFSVEEKCAVIEKAWELIWP